MDWLKQHWKSALLAVGCLIGAVMLWVGFHQERQQPHVGVAVVAKDDPKVARQQKTDTPVKTGTVQTYTATDKAKLDLPASVQADANQQVIDASRVVADDHPQTVTTVIDTKTGATETYVSRDPLPLFAIDTSGEGGAYYGYRNGAAAFRIEARQGLFVIKALHFGVIGSLDQVMGAMQTGPGTFIGVGAWARW